VSARDGLQGAFGRELERLAQLPGMRLMLELGTWYGGGSSLCLARGLPLAFGRVGAFFLMDDALLAPWATARFDARRDALTQLEQTKETGRSTAATLEQDREKIKRIDQGLDEVDSELELSKKLILRFVKRIYTDKVGGEGWAEGRMEAGGGRWGRGLACVACVAWELTRTTPHPPPMTEESSSSGGDPLRGMLLVMTVHHGLLEHSKQVLSEREVQLKQAVWEWFAALPSQELEQVRARGR
jgi:hypothetical protein